jgi:energy-coupling factor transporter ATP-binding protein EcfA2
VVEAADEILRFEDLSFKYMGLDLPTLQDVNLSMRKGEIAVLAGASGSGKTTLLRCINGLIPHIYPGEYSGRVVVDGLVAQDTPTYELAKKIGFLFQNPENQIFMFTVERDIAFGLENLGVERSEIARRVDESLKLLSIEDLRNRSPSELSDGQKQRVAIAGALAMGPELLVLDEPTSLLDPRTANDVVALVKGLNAELGLSVLLVEHRLELVAPIADQLIIMSGGRIWKSGPPVEVLASEGIHEVGLSAPTVVELQRQLRSLGRWSGKIDLSVDAFYSEAKETWR